MQQALEGVRAVYFNESGLGGRMQSKMNQCSLDGPVAKAFFTALLLTQSSRRAQEAVIESIHFLNPEEPFDEALLRDTVDASIRTYNEALPVSRDEWEAAFTALPLELHGVLALPADLRRCFVLRILLQFPPEPCARILNLNTDEVDQYTCDALWSLPAYQADASHPAGRAILLKAQPD
jgi:hypothetical protein